MENAISYGELVKQAQRGDEQSLNKLSELVQERLYTYVYRMVLREDQARDIVQETVVEMYKVLGKLRDSDSFWPWLRRMAFFKMHRRFVEEKQSKHAPSNGRGSADWRSSQEGLAGLVGEELKQVVRASMAELKPEYRSVLAMRCYEEMEYSEIAELMGKSELSTRVLFLRAKKSLAKQLSRRGLGRGALVTALLLFGKLTAPTEAAAAQITVTAGSLKVGLAAGAAGLAMSKAFVATVTTAGVITAGTVFVDVRAEKALVLPQNGEEKQVQTTAPVASKAYAGQESWYYYPLDSTGPVMTRVIKLDAQGGRAYCLSLENETANYHYDIASNTINIDNRRQWNSDLSVRRLPTDTEAMRHFLNGAPGYGNAMQYVSESGSGFLVSVASNGNGGHPAVIYHRNVLDEEYFRYDWPAGAGTIDNRDAMHKRGWTYLRIAGQIGNERVDGIGRLPFVYEASTQNPAWLRIKVGGIELKEAGFFGLARPWMGLHTIDQVRRDAAQTQIKFETGSIIDGRAEVSLTGEKAIVRYTIDMEKDLIEKLTLLTKDGVKTGELTFQYLEDVSGAGREFTGQPGRNAGSAAHWLMNLAERAINSK